MINGHAILTNSRIRSFKACRRKHYFEYVLGVRRKPGEALRIGSAVHMALDLLKQGRDLQDVFLAVRDNYAPLIDAADDPEWRAKMEVEQVKVLCLVEGWDWRWQDADFEVVASEIQFDQRIFNPGPGGRWSKKFRLSGKIDAIVRLDDGRLALLEHKTCSEDLSADSKYWQHLKLDQQISLYNIAARNEGHDIETTIYDVIRKPSIAPKNVPSLDTCGLKIVIDAAGERVLKKDGEPKQSADAKAGQKLLATIENPTQYGIRLRADIQARPDFYFARVEIPRLHDDLHEFRHELWQIQQDINLAVINNRHFRNSDSCFSPYPCAYFDVCTTGVDLTQETPDGFERLDFLHPELEEITNGNGTAAPNDSQQAIVRAATD